MRRLHQPDQFPLSDSGFPKPVNGDASMLEMRLLILVTRRGVVASPGTAGAIVSFDWSLDDRSLVFDYGSDIRTTPRDLQAPKPLIGIDGLDDAPAVNPVDGRLVWHNSSSGLYVSNSDGTGRQLIPNSLKGDFFPTWSPDGTWIAFSRQTGTPAVSNSIYKIRPDGSGLTALLLPSGPLVFSSTFFGATISTWTP